MEDNGGLVRQTGTFTPAASTIDNVVESGKRLDDWSIIGICLGSLVAVIAVVMIIITVRRRKRKRHESRTYEEI